MTTLKTRKVFAAAACSLALLGVAACGTEDTTAAAPSKESSSAAPSEASMDATSDLVGPGCADYAKAVSARAGAILKAHPSNFRMTGFTGRPRLADLVQLGRESCIPVYEDLGSGCLIDLRPSGIDEPLARTSLDAGVNLISFSGDKLLGGPQAGIIAGDAELVPRVRRNPLFRAFRQDKLVYAALETTLRHILLEQYDCVPALRMIRLTAEQIRGRAENLAKRLSGSLSIEPGESVIGGGSTPELSLPTWLIAIEEENANALEQRLRANAPPIISRIERDRVVLDLRTVFQEEEDAIVQALS